MRSSTIFLVFGGIILALLIFTRLSSLSVAHGPVMGTVNKFMTAVAENDLSTLQKLTDPNTVRLSRAGSKLVSMHCAGITPYDGAFLKRPAVTWGYVELVGLSIKPNTEPEVVENVGLASVALANGGRIYLHQVDNQWKLFYLARPEDEKKDDAQQ